jgi:hypothetical protein
VLAPGSVPPASVTPGECTLTLRSLSPAAVTGSVVRT